MATAGVKMELSPYKVCACVLIYESLTNMSVFPSTRAGLHSYLISQLFAVKDREPSLQELITDLDVLDHNSIGLTLSIQEPLPEVLTRALKDLEHCNDLIILFNSRLTELRSDAEINLGYMEEGGILYLFLRKCLISFAVLDFEGLIRLFEKLQGYKSGAVPESLPDTDVTMLVSDIADNLPRLCTQETYMELSLRIGKLPASARWLLQAHLDSYYHLPSAVDLLHRHFDQDLDRTLPPQSIRVSKASISKSFTYYASLHRVKIELQLGHLETAVHLLVETVKRELSEGDTAAILESSLLFCKIAGLTGSWVQERSLSEKCILRAIEKKNATAIILSAMNCAQLDAIYPHLHAPDILRAIKPKADPPSKKKTQGPVEATFFHDHKVSTGAAVLNLATQTMLQAGFFHQYSSQLLQVQVLSWLSTGSLTSAMATFSVLRKLHPDVLSHREDVQVALTLARESCWHSRKDTMELLRLVDTACPVKDCLDWEFTVDYISNVWSLLQGKFIFAEHFEKKLQDAASARLDKFYTVTSQRLKAMRLLSEEKYPEAHQILTSLSTDLQRMGWQSLLIQTALLQSENYLSVGQHLKALYEVLRCLPALKHSRKDAYAVQIQLAEVLLVLYPNSIKSLMLLHRIRPLLLEEATAFTQGKFFTCRAKCKLSLALKMSANVHIRKSAVADLNAALLHYQEIAALLEVREVYYLLARTFHDLNLEQARDEAAAQFNGLNLMLNLAGKEVPAAPQIQELNGEVRFPVVDVDI